MPGFDRTSIRLICGNPECINKSVVWRKLSHDPNCFTCKKCGSILERFKSPRAVKQDLKAKQDLRELGAE